ncbi:hypothetical protein GF1_07180 [Desulfolithobacter dissulfuricans]|uniref:Uncharacterized protein n=1 Tax=Desulfolithobacter dissulfuricans TaxID=2795293 RepID=A0A915U0T6_9BACT|nr:hypothetical protein [Desulfolithobacter dissulfuricans]BCO08342.1 hypothetical protein GF1_07180 [Desulfolithobacter dissulfuricans]
MHRNPGNHHLHNQLITHKKQPEHPLVSDQTKRHRKETGHNQEACGEKKEAGRDQNPIFFSEKPDGKKEKQIEVTEK